MKYAQQLHLFTEMISNRQHRQQQKHIACGKTAHDRNNWTYCKKYTSKKMKM